MEIIKFGQRIFVKYAWYAEQGMYQTAENIYKLELNDHHLIFDR